MCTAVQAGDGVRLEACRWTAGGSSLECAHSGGGQLQGSRVVSCTCTAAEAWSGFLCCSWALARQWGSTQVAGISQHEYLWVKAGEICMWSMAAVLAVGLYSGESTGVIFRAGHLEP